MNTLLAIHSHQKLPKLGHCNAISVDALSVIRRRRRTSEVGI
jgi:hypothetical protein